MTLTEAFNDGVETVLDMIQDGVNQGLSYEESFKSTWTAQRNCTKKDRVKV
jgi:hypothetical protein